MRGHGIFGRGRTLGLVLGVLANAGAAGAIRAQRGSDSWVAVERTLGRPGARLPGGVARFGFPRGDLSVKVGDVPLRPALALGSWVAFARGGGATDVMGDLVLTEGEIGAVIDRLLQGGVAPTALHNHLAGETPRVMYLHVHGRGDATVLAETIRAALGLTGTPLGMPPAVTEVRIDLDTAMIARTLGVGGRVTGGVYQVSVPRAESIRAGGHPVPAAMGTATAINFQALGAGRAAITGDFVMTAREVDAVTRALRGAGITITALHSHMLDETPRLLFMHFWAVDDAATLARGLRGALDEMHVAR